MMGNEWCILRTSGPKTLPLAASLAEAGFAAWSPIEYQVTRPKPSRNQVERQVAVMPTYVFAAFREIGAILAERPSGKHPSFALLHYDDRVPLVAERDLAHLRRIEREAAAKRQPVVFQLGQEVRVPDGPFQGLGGKVVETDKGWALVAFPRFAIPVKFGYWQIEVVDVSAPNARAA